MSTQDSKAGTVYKTTKYSRFKTLQGNRDVTEARVAKIMRSVERIGYIPEPIVVNEKMLERLGKHWNETTPISTIRGAVEELQKMYNYRNTNKAFVIGDYDRAVAQQEAR